MLKSFSFRGLVEFHACTSAFFQPNMVFQNCHFKQGLDLLFSTNDDQFYAVVANNVMIDDELSIYAPETNVYLEKFKYDGNHFDVRANRITTLNASITLHGYGSIANSGMHGGTDDDSMIVLDHSSVINKYTKPFLIKQSSSTLLIDSCRFDGSTQIYGLGDKVYANIRSSTFDRVGLYFTAELARSSYVDIESMFRDQPFGYYVSDSDSLYSGMGRQLGDNQRYKQLLRQLKIFYDYYLEGGDILAANKIYVRIKELETKKLEYERETNNTFDLSIRIWLNKILRFYTAYGTDPARAIVISIYVIVCFGIFYVFFPSSWDVASKSKIVSDLRNLRQVRKGKARDVRNISINVIIALLNAFTLSLNSFVTLGFGEIPTKGAARYITIVEGFLGWFLLTLFSVALISQSSF
jgi:hypothetical protein